MVGLAIMNRIGCSMTAAGAAVDDLGNMWVFGIDSAATIVKACDASVRRSGLQRICKALPGLDSGKVERPRTVKDRGILIAFVDVVQPAIRGKRFKPPDGCVWEKEWAAMLGSAMNGWQCPQALKAQVPPFETHLEPVPAVPAGGGDTSPQSAVQSYVTSRGLAQTVGGSSTGEKKNAKRPSHAS